MPFLLSNRDVTSRERMEDPNCDPAELQNTYRQFSKVNSLISQWKRLYKQEIRPHLHPEKPTNLLDIGFGGGDIPIKIAKWAKKEGLNLQVTAIDPDPRAFKFVQSLERPQTVEFLQCDIADLDPGEEQFDLVISNHLLHHLSHEALTNILTKSRSLSKKAVIFTDIRRSDWAYILFNIFAPPVFRSSFITEDGLTSIKRSYTLDELVQSVPNDWHVKSLFPFRLLLKYNHE